MLKKVKILVITLVMMFAFPLTVSAASDYGHIMHQTPQGHHMEYNRAIKLSNGDILAITNIRYDASDWAMRFYKSTDNGETFFFLSEFKDYAETKTIGCPDIYEVSPGNILLAYTVYDEYYYPAGMKCKIQRSTDDGATWSYVTTVEDGTWNWEPEFATSADGKLQIFYSYSAYDMDMMAQAIVRRESADGGTTWSDAITVKGVVGSDSSLNCGMPRVTRTENGLYYLAYEVYEDATCVHVSVGTDGKTFGELTDGGVKMQSETGWMASAPTLVSINDTLIGIGKNYKNQGSMNDHPNTGKVFLISRDGGNTWVESPLPLEIVYNDDHQNWSPEFLPLSDTSLFYITTSFLDGRDATVYNTGFVNASAENYNIVNRFSNKNLDTLQNNVNDGDNVVQWTNNGENSQKWKLEEAGAYYKIVNVNSGKLLDVYGHSTLDGGSVVQWADNGGDNQLWQVSYLGNGYYTIINKETQKVLDVHENSLLDGGKIVQWEYNGGLNQQWSFH